MWLITQQLEQARRGVIYESLATEAGLPISPITIASWWRSRTRDFTIASWWRRTPGFAIAHWWRSRTRGFTRASGWRRTTGNTRASWRRRSPGCTRALNIRHGTPWIGSLSFTESGQIHTCENEQCVTRSSAGLEPICNCCASCKFWKLI